MHWARQAAARFPAGQLYVDLRGSGSADPPREPACASRCLLEALSVPAERIPASAEARAALYRSLLADRPALIVIDNARDSGQVRPLLPAGPCLVVVTSRNELADVIAAEGATPLALGPLSKDEACELLTTRLGCERTAAEPQATGELAELCARLPRALTVAAARVAPYPARSLADLADDLRESRLGEFWQRPHQRPRRLIGIYG